MPDHIHLLRHDIHSSSDIDFFATGGYDAKVSSLVDSFSTGDSQNLHMYAHVIQELNKRYEQLGLSNKVCQPVDAGLRPLNFNNFFNQQSESSSQPANQSDGLSYLQPGGSLYLQPDGVSLYKQP